MGVAALQGYLAFITANTHLQVRVERPTEFDPQVIIVETDGRMSASVCRGGFSVGLEPQCAEMRELARRLTPSISITDIAAVFLVCEVWLNDLDTGEHAAEAITTVGMRPCDKAAIGVVQMISRDGAGVMTLAKPEVSEIPVNSPMLRAFLTTLDGLGGKQPTAPWLN